MLRLFFFCPAMLLSLFLNLFLFSLLMPLKAKTGINLCKNTILRQKGFLRNSSCFTFIISYIWITKLNCATI